MVYAINIMVWYNVRSRYIDIVYRSVSKIRSTSKTNIVSGTKTAPEPIDTVVSQVRNGYLLHPESSRFYTIRTRA